MLSEQVSSWEGIKFVCPLSASKPGEGKSALVSQGTLIDWDAWFPSFVLYPVVNLFAFGSRPQGGSTVTHDHLFLVVLLACCVRIRVQLPLHVYPNKPSLAGRNAFSFETITPNVPCVQIALGDQWWRFQTENTWFSYHVSYVWVTFFWKKQKQNKKNPLNMRCRELS